MKYLYLYDHISYIICIYIYTHIYIYVIMHSRRDTDMMTRPQFVDPFPRKKSMGFPETTVRSPLQYVPWRKQFGG